MENQESLAKLDDRPKNNWFKKALKHRISFLRLRMIESMGMTVEEFNALEDEDQLPGPPQVVQEAQADDANQPGEDTSISSEASEDLLADPFRRRGRDGENQDGRPTQRRRRC